MKVSSPPWRGNARQCGTARLQKLAQKIDALAARDAELLAEARRIAELRQQAARELHAVCAGFAASLNPLLKNVQIELDPPADVPFEFRDPGVNILQLNIRGRVVQIEFRATDTPTCTERFRLPYILEGAVRCYDQARLENVEIQEHLLFYCLDKKNNLWLFFDPRTHRSGPFDENYLVGLWERLV